MKNSYILLRNNKESTPLYLEDLQKIGLMTSDLIWVECQSVGWRRPEEIAELKALVPENNHPDVKINCHDSKEDIPDHLETMPPINIEKIPASAENLPVENFHQIESLKPLSDSLSDNMKKYGAPDNSGLSIVDKKEIDLKTNYSRPLNEIKEMYVKNLEKNEHRKKNIVEIQLPIPIKKIVLYTGLVLAGALMMLFIKDTGNKNISAVRPDNKQTDSVIAPLTALSAALEKDFPDTTENYEKQSLPPEEQKPTVAINKNIPLKINNEKTEDREIKTEKIEISTKPENEIKNYKTVTTENISSKLALKANDYNVGSFGGIRNLEMTLQNDSKYFLDRVIVEINYLNPEGVIIKTDNIFFQSIQPGNASTIPVNKTKRGVKINYKITKIETKELVSEFPETAETNNYTSK